MRKKTPIPDDVNRILRQIETEKRLCELNEDDQNKIRRLSQTSPKVRMALRTAQLRFIQKKKSEAYKRYIAEEVRENESVNEETSVISIVRETAEQVTDFISSLRWIPDGAGEAIVAADISEQEKTIKTDEGEIRITCVWGGETDDDPAYIWVKWDAGMKSDAEFVIQIINPETHKIYYEIRPGKIRQGNTTIESEKLKFDPTEIKWGIAVTKECDKKS